MRMCAAAALVMLAAFAVAEDGPPPVSEAAMEASCRSNLSTLATALAMYRAREGVYPDSLQQLNGMGGISSSTPFHDLACPSCGERYEYGVEGDGFTLACPAEEPHGEVIDGAFNW